MLQKRLGRVPSSYDTRRFRRERPIVVTPVDQTPESAKKVSTLQKAARTATPLDVAAAEPI